MNYVSIQGLPALFLFVISYLLSYATVTIMTTAACSLSDETGSTSFFFSHLDWDGLYSTDDLSPHDDTN